MKSQSKIPVQAKLDLIFFERYTRFICLHCPKFVWMTLHAFTLQALCESNCYAVSASSNQHYNTRFFSPFRKNVSVDFSVLCYQTSYCHVTVMQEARLPGVQAHPQMFWIVENLRKIPENSGKTSENLSKITENLNPWKSGQKWRLTLFALDVWRKTQLRPFLEMTSQTGLHVLCGRKFVGKKRTKLFGQV